MATRNPNVTGAGARYGASALKNVPTASVKAAYTNRETMKAAGGYGGSNIPQHSEAAPSPPSASTGTEHLSPSQFPDWGAKYASRTTTTSSMHPGGYSSGKPITPKAKTFAHPMGMHPGGGSAGNSSRAMGNVAPGAPMTVRKAAPPYGTPPSWAKNATRGKTMTSPVSSRSASGTSSRNIPAGTKKAVNKLGGAGGNNKRGSAVKTKLKVKASKYAGSLAGHLRNATGIK